MGGFEAGTCLIAAAGNSGHGTVNWKHLLQEPVLKQWPYSTINAWVKVLCVASSGNYVREKRGRFEIPSRDAALLACRLYYTTWACVPSCAAVVCLQRCSSTNLLEVTSAEETLLVYSVNVSSGLRRCIQKYIQNLDGSGTPGILQASMYIGLD